MKKLFFAGILLLLLFEILNIYFIMPFPGSQRSNTIDTAHFLYTYRWAFRLAFTLLIVYALIRSSWRKKWIPFVSILISGFLIYVLNFQMQADKMFLQPKELILSTSAKNKVKLTQLVIGVEINGKAKAYPIQYLGYHHQVLDSVGGMPIMITYCTVCHTGRVFEPKVNGKYERFRLVGMDHFNAMFEDETTKSWWQQATGKAISGKLKGQQLPEVKSEQTSLRLWLLLHPESLIMQPDPGFATDYKHMANYEKGLSKSSLTKTDTASWKDKSLVIGVQAGTIEKAYDWNELKKQQIINDKIGTIPVVLLLASDGKSFFAFQKPNDQPANIQKDTLYFNNTRFSLEGKQVNGSAQLAALPAYQEFWHSWRTFHPKTLR